MSESNAVAAVPKSSALNLKPSSHRPLTAKEDKGAFKRKSSSPLRPSDDLYKLVGSSAGNILNPFVSSAP